MRAGRAEANGPLILGTNPDYSEANTSVDDGRFPTEADLSHAARAGGDRHRRPRPSSAPRRGGPGHHRERRAPTAMGSSSTRKRHVRQQRQLRGRPHHYLRRAVPRWQTGPRDTIHIATVPPGRGRLALIEEETAILARAARPAPRPAQRLRALHEPGPAGAVPTDYGGGRGHAHHRRAAPWWAAGVMKHHARQRHPAHPRDRRAQGHRGHPARHRHAVPGGGGHAHRRGAAPWASGWGWGRHSRPAWPFAFQAAAPLWAVLLGFGVSTAVGRLRPVARGEGLPPGPHRGPAAEVTIPRGTLRGRRSTPRRRSAAPLGPAGRRPRCSTAPAHPRLLVVIREMPPGSLVSTPQKMPGMALRGRRSQRPAGPEDLDVVAAGHVRAEVEPDSLTGGLNSHLAAIGEEVRSDRHAVHAEEGRRSTTRSTAVVFSTEIPGRMSPGEKQPLFVVLLKGSGHASTEFGARWC